MPFSLFKKKKEEKPTAEVRKEKAEGKKPTEAFVSALDSAGQAYKTLKNPLITEKAAELAKANQYVFKVWPRANKNEIKRAIEGIYKISVMAVRIVNIPAKQRRLGKIMGLKRGYKKAVVKIKAGQKIEVLPR